MIFNEAKKHFANFYFSIIYLSTNFGECIMRNFLSLGIRNFSGPIKATHDNWAKSLSFSSEKHISII